MSRGRDELKAESLRYVLDAGRRRELQKNARLATHCSRWIVYSMSRRKGARGKLEGGEVYQFGAGERRKIRTNVTTITAFGLARFGKWPKSQAFPQAAKECTPRRKPWVSAE